MPANKPLLVGSFALGGLALGVVAILLFSGRHFFAVTTQAVVVFNGSVSGLDVGSAVTFRGVNVGKVTAMKLEVNAANNTGQIPVTLELERDRISWTNGLPEAGNGQLERAVAAGLRAQLVARSIVTGLYNVDLDFHPGMPTEPVHTVGGLFEIPTIPSDLQSLKEEVEALNLRDLAARTRQAVTSLQTVLDQLGSQVGPLASHLTTTLDATTTMVRAVQADAERTLHNIDELAAESRSEIATNGKDLDLLLQSAERTATGAQGIVASLNDITGPRSPARTDLQTALRDLAASASSLRNFTRNLERNPAGTLLRSNSK